MSTQEEVERFLEFWGVKDHWTVGELAEQLNLSYAAVSTKMPAILKKRGFKFKLVRAGKRGPLSKAYYYRGKL